MNEGKCSMEVVGVTHRFTRTSVAFLIDIIERDKLLLTQLLSCVLFLPENNVEAAYVLLSVLILHGTVIAGLIKRNILCL